MEPLTFVLNLQVLFLVLGFYSGILVCECPRLCECKWKSGKESVICTNANLSSVPLELDAGTQLLDLTSNNLITVKHDEFSKAGLLNLQKIYISKCRLKSLERYAFRNLINLVELDLSYNVLPAIPSHGFESIPELRELKLTGNPIQRIMNEAFVHVPRLVKLELSDCKIGNIETKAFYGLEKSLEWLKLDKNKLAEVQAASFTILQSLHELELAENPWNCSCKLRPLREWMTLHNVPFGIPPVCRYPNRLIFKSWDKLELDEFACVPEIVALDPRAHGIEGKNVTLTCHITGIPEPNVRWLLKNKVISNLTGAPYTNGKKFYVVHLQNSSSDLTILTADVQDAGVYTCAAENKAGRSEASVTLAVSRRPLENAFSKKVLIASILAGLFFVLISCAVALCVCTVRKKQVIQWRNRNLRREDNYEKIEMNHKAVSNANVKGEIAQSELIGAGLVRKNGEYRLVPGAEAEQDVDKEEEGFEATTSATKNCNSAASPAEKWNPPELSLLDSEDLHIPRRTIKDNRDDRRKNLPLMSGIYNQDYSSTSGAVFHGHLIQPDVGCASSTSTELSTFVDDDSDKKYPDLIEASSSAHRGSLRAISEGNSVSDFSELYCTLPRKAALRQKDNWKYCSTDSQFPLLQDSRYSSSGGDSTGSQVSSTRRMSDTNKHTFLHTSNRVNQRSNSYINLTSSRQQSSPPTPIHENPPNSTPLLDINSLDNRVSYRRPIVSPTPSPMLPTISNSYDYHAAQLERFLEEYRHLQKELTKMKETCENLTREKTPTKFLDPLLGNSCSPVSPMSDIANAKLNSAQSSLMPNSPNSNQTLDSSINRLGNELSKYLLTRNSSPETFNNGVLNNN